MAYFDHTRLASSKNNIELQIAMSTEKHSDLAKGDEPQSAPIIPPSSDISCV
jgi:hypothetical protein